LREQKWEGEEPLREFRARVEVEDRYRGRGEERIEKTLLMPREWKFLLP